MTIDSFVRPALYLSPEPDPIRGTLLDAATVVANGVPSQDTTGLFESFNCLTTDSVAVLPCPATTLAAPVQSASSTATTGGTLAAGTYRAKITAINSRGETVASNEQSQVTTGAASTITWNWASVSGATGYKVYVTGVGGGANSETFLVTVGAVLTYIWTGTPAFSAGNAAPPSSNTAVVPVVKTFNGPSWQDGIKFAVYSGVICKAPGFDIEDAGTQLERVFANKESVAVARTLMQQRFIASASHWAAATDLTPVSGAVDPVVGLAMLEGHASYSYAGQPTLHVPRTIGSLLLNKYAAIVYDGDMLRTLMGAKVAADGGYESPSNSPTNSAPAAGELWLYASGEVTLAATEPVQQRGIDLVESGDSNRVRLLRERMYVATVDCYTAAVRVKVQ